MIEKKTLDTVQKALEELATSRRTLEHLRDIEQGEWLPGNGPKPERMRYLEQVIHIIEEQIKMLDALWG